MATKKTVATTIGVKEVPVGSLRANPHNPRMLFDRQPMGVLRESIKRVGILVPLTVYRDSKRGDYVILDGQRRWMCAQEVGKATVPVNEVAEPTLVQNIVTMFQIHKLREDWELMPTALKVELLMRELGDRNDARLAELTGLDVAVIARCKKLISYDREFQDLMLDPDPEKRVKADFFIELYPVVHDREVSKLDWFKEKPFVRQMLAKYQEEPRTIRAVTDFRTIKQHITSAKRAGKNKQLSRRLRRFAESHEVRISYLEIDEATVHAEAKAITKKLNQVRSAVEEIDIEQFYGEEELWVAAEELQAVLRSTLRRADRRR